MTFKNIRSLQDVVYQSPGGFSGIKSSLFYGSSTTTEKETVINTSQMAQLLKTESINFINEETLVIAIPLTDYSGEVKWFLQSEVDYSAMIAQEKLSICYF